MNDLQKELLRISDLYSALKNNLDKIEREYNLVYAKEYLQERILGLKTEEMRKNEMTLIMQMEHGELLDTLQTQRGDTREAYYKREALAIILSGQTKKE
jgi:hypothetical protein